MMLQQEAEGRRGEGGVGGVGGSMDGCCQGRQLIWW